jgi:tRNA nucleotidyltransferase (CCA-adding enzyme)
VVGLLRRLEAAGHETWCVGGAIRDALLGDLQQDMDLATAARPEEVQRLFRRTVAVGVEHGTVGVFDEQGVLHEVTTFRRDVVTDGRHAQVEFGRSLDEDLARRDLTINAIAYHPLRHAWRDPFGGRNDLHDRIVRAVGDPVARFREDRLRILRTIRFAARLDFHIDPATWQAACAQAGDTAHLSAERVRDEWSKSIRTTRSLDRLVGQWLESGVATVWLPELLADTSWHRAGVPDVVLATALVCSACAPVMRRFKASNAEIRRAEAIDRGPARPRSNAPAEVRRWMAAVGDASADLVTLATWRGMDADAWTSEVAGVRARGEATTRSALAVNGDDLRIAGVAAGPEIGLALGRLLEAVLEDPGCNTREQLLALARRPE